MKSTNSYAKKGGLIGLASCGIGVSNDINNYIHMLLPPVLSCFDDEDARIRFYACEAPRGVILEFMNEIFSSLCELYADVDVEVKEISTFAFRFDSFTCRQPLFSISSSRRS